MQTSSQTNTLLTLLKAFHKDEDGAGATEYIILLILIACVVIAIVKSFGSTVQQKYQSADNEVGTKLTF